MESKLTSTFLQALEPLECASGQPPDPAAIESAIRDQLRVARAHWPRIEVDEAAFATFIAGHIDPEKPVLRGLTKLDAAELYLLLAVCQGNAEAARKFEASYYPEVALAVRSIAPNPDQIGDFQQLLFEQVFIGGASSAPKLDLFHQYRGRFSTWWRVMAARRAIDHWRKNKSRRLEDDESLANAIEPDDDPELRFVKQEFAEEFKKSFQNAFEALPPKDRTLLRYQVLDQLTMAQIGKLRGVHAATATRWLAAIRERLLSDTRRRLVEVHSLAHDDVGSVMRAAHQHVNVSLSRLLGGRKSPRK